MKRIYVLKLGGQVHGDDADEVDVLVSSNDAVVYGTLEVFIHDCNSEKVGPGSASEAMAHLNHPVSHLGSKLALYFVPVQRILRRGGRVMKAHGAMHLEGVYELFALEGFVHVLQRLTVH